MAGTLRGLQHAVSRKVRFRVALALFWGSELELCPILQD